MVVYPPHSLNHIIFKNNYKKIFLSQLIVVSLYIKLYNIRIMNKTNDDFKINTDKVYSSLDLMKFTLKNIDVLDKLLSKYNSLKKLEITMNKEKEL